MEYAANLKALNSIARQVFMHSHIGKLESFPEEIANAVYFLCCDQSLTITGTEMTVDSGISVCLLPYNKEWNKHE